ncbi:MAG: hypothetical protein P8185_05275, partial [Deltaproteobacteria bacterium]
ISSRADQDLKAWGNDLQPREFKTGTNPPAILWERLPAAIISFRGLKPLPQDGGRVGTGFKLSRLKAAPTSPEMETPILLCIQAFRE